MYKLKNYSISDNSGTVILLLRNDIYYIYFEGSGSYGEPDILASFDSYGKACESYNDIIFALEKNVQKHDWIVDGF